MKISKPVLLVILLAFGLRVVALNSLPLSLSLDEATNGLDALWLIRLAQFTPFLQNNFGRETLYFYLQGLGLWLYGISFFSLRYISVLLGTLTVPLLYVVGGRLGLSNLCWPEISKSALNQQKPQMNIVGLLAATGLAFSYWHIFFSRLGLRAILLPPLLLGLIWCFWRGWYGSPKEQRRRLWLVMAGFLLGLSGYTYLAARLLPLLFTVFVAQEIVRHKSGRIKKITDFFIFGATATLVATPLMIYFQQNPQGFSRRIQNISIFPSGDSLNLLSDNLAALLQIHFLGGTWLEKWPALNLLSALGLALGLLVCVYHFKKPPFLFLLLWWAIGITPVLASEQDWERQSTILRGIVAWPAIFLISAVGLTVLAKKAANTLINAWPSMKKYAPNHEMVFNGLFSLLFIFAGVSGIYNYFWAWAKFYHKFSDDPTRIVRYLNDQTDQMTLIPAKVYGQHIVNFLLQARYPILTNIDTHGLQALLASNRSSVYLLLDRSAGESLFVLLVPEANGQGTAYLLPPLTFPQVEALYNNTERISPLATLLDSQQTAIAHVYPLQADASFLPDASWPTHPIEANFNDKILLTGYRIDPPSIKPNETTMLYLTWQAQQPIDGSYQLFIHLYNISHNQRQGQVNAPLKGMLFHAHRWPVGLTVPDIHYFHLPEDAPEGPYLFEMGLYHTDSQGRLPIMASADQPLDDKITLGKLQVRQHPPPPPQYPFADYQFEANIRLTGLDLPASPLQPGQTLTYTLHWQATGPISQSYTVFTHLLDAEGNLQAQLDRIPQQGHYPTTWWSAGETVMDPYALPLPDNLAAGPFKLRVGLYLPETGQRLRLKNNHQDFIDLPIPITITTVRN